MSFHSSRTTIFWLLKGKVKYVNDDEETATEDPDADVEATEGRKLPPYALQLSDEKRDEIVSYLLVGAGRGAKRRS